MKRGGKSVGERVLVRGRRGSRREGVAGERRERQHEEKGKVVGERELESCWRGEGEAA